MKMTSKEMVSNYIKKSQRLEIKGTNELPSIFVNDMRISGVKWNDSPNINYINTTLNGNYRVVSITDLKIIDKDLERLENIDKKAVGFIQFLINSISKRKLNDDQMEIMNMETGEEYGNLKEYITKKMKELFNVDIKWNI